MLLTARCDLLVVRSRVTPGGSSLLIIAEGLCAWQD